MGLDGRPDEEGNILKKEGCGTCQMQTPDQRKVITELFRICQEFKKHCQRHNGPEGSDHITSSTQILIKLQFRNLD